jgi:SAM-dependent methyltransferase
MDTRTQRHRRDLARYYRWLDRLEWFRVARGEAGHDAHPIHRALRDPATPEASASPFLVHRLMVEGLDLPPDPDVLDAGCGYGATAFDLLPVIGGRWLGLTLSAVQARRGEAEAVRRGLAGRVRFRVASYDTPLDQRFDLVLGIESLIHSPDPRHSIANLVAALHPGGYLVMVDDMPEPGLDRVRAADLATFTRMWRCPVAPGRDGWAAALQAAGLEMVSERDLTPLTIPRDPATLEAPMAAARRRVRWLGPLGLAMRTQADLGGMALERLLHAGAVRYRLMVGRKGMEAAPAPLAPSAALVA